MNNEKFVTEKELENIAGETLAGTGRRINACKCLITPRREKPIAVVT